MSGIERAASASASLALLARRHDRARRVVRRVHEHRASAVIHERQNLLRGLRKALLTAAMRTRAPAAPGARQHRHRWIRGLRQDDGAAVSGEQAGERDQRFGGARHDQHLIRIDAVQRRDTLAQ